MAATIRPALAEDVDTLAVIEAAAFAGDRISRRSFARLVRAPTASLLVAAAGQRIAGYALLLFRTNSQRARLYSIAVRPDGGGQGVGRELLAAAEGEALRRGSLRLGLEVRRDNRRAISLYERGGYRRVGEVTGYYQDGEHAYRYEKALAGSLGRPATAAA